MKLTMLILCTKLYLDSWVDELGDWREKGVQILLYGKTSKANEGFIFVGWNNPIPERFRRKLIEDEVIIDFFVFGMGETTETPPPVTRLSPQL